eukprot:Tamp_34334.p1 GENE.Tamp_34334~~Tamp_34334.p1  ORF type:complete len:186 (+),score=10.58 Tamp_34334:66-560(+)
MTCRPGCTSFDFSAQGCSVLADASMARLACCVSSLPCVEMYSVNDIHTSSDNGRTWTLISQPAGWSPRSFVGLAVIQSGLVAFGGFSGSGSFYNDLWLSEDGGQTWREITASGNAPGPRSGSRLVPLLSGDSCLVVAGWQRTYLPGGARSVALYLADAWVVPEI